MSDKVGPGSRISDSVMVKSEFVNDLVDLRAAYKLGNLSNGPGESKAGKLPDELIKVKNSTGSDRQAGDVVQLGEYLLHNGYSKRRRWFDAIEPADLLATYGVLWEPIKEDEIGYAIISSLMPIRWYSGDGTPSANQIWGVKAGEYALRKNRPGYRFVSVAESSNSLGWFMPEPIERLLVKAPSSAKAAYNASSDFAVYVGPESSPVTASQTLSCRVTAADIFRDKFAEAVMRNGEWIVEQRSMLVAGTLAGSLSQGSTATVNVGSDTVTGRDKVMKTGATAIASGKKCYIAWNDFEKEWDIITVECA